MRAHSAGGRTKRATIIAALVCSDVHDTHEASQVSALVEDPPADHEQSPRPEVQHVLRVLGVGWQGRSPEHA